MFLSAILFGVLGSFHCIGMCGPIAFMLPVDRQKPLKTFFQILSYHFGRLLTYSFIGLLFGILGKGFYFFGFQQQLSIIAGVLMIFIILFPRIFKKFSFSKNISTIIFRIKNSLGKEVVSFNQKWTNPIALHHLKSGVYFIEIQLQGHCYTERLLVF